MTSTGLFRSSLAALLAVAGAAGSALPSHAAESASNSAIEQFYRGRTINLIITAGVGGGYDTYGRLFARHFGRNLPGQPSVVAQNMIGAGGLRGAFYLYNVAPKDGTELAIMQAETVTAPLFDPKNAKFDGSRFTAIGNLNQEGSVCVAWHDAPIKTAKDLFAKEYIVASTGPGNSLEIYPNVLNNLFGTNIKVVAGYSGGTTTLLAIERGEVHGRCGSSLATYNTTRPDWIEGNKLNVVLQTGLEKDPELPPDTPWIMDLVKTDEQRQILELVLGPNQLGRPFFGTPDIPADRVQALRAAFDATAKDPEFLSEAKKARLDIRPMTGAKVSAFVAKFYQSSPAIREAAAKAQLRKDDAKKPVSKAESAGASGEGKGSRSGGGL